MKRKYVTPDLKVANFETNESVMDDVTGSWTDPFANPINGEPKLIMDWWNFPNGTELNEDGSPK